MLDEMFQRNALNFDILLEKKLHVKSQNYGKFRRISSKQFIRLTLLLKRLTVRKYVCVIVYTMCDPYILLILLQLTKVVFENELKKCK